MFHLLALEAQQSGSQSAASRGQRNDVALFFVVINRSHYENTQSH